MGNHLIVSKATVTKSGEATLVVKGDIDFTVAAELKSEGESLVAGMGDRVVVDLQEAGRMGSVAVSVLLCWLRMARAKGKEMVIVNMPRKMFDVVRMSGLDDVLPIGPSE